MSWRKIKLGDFLRPRNERFEPNSKSLDGLKKIQKIEFSGNIVVSEYQPTKTEQIIVYNKDLVFSGLNIEKGAICLNLTDQNLTVSTNYSSLEVDYSIVDETFFSFFLKSKTFNKILRKHLSKDYSFTKPKQLLPIEISLPNINEQKEIAKKFFQVQDESLLLSKSISYQAYLLSELRKSLLKEALQGKLVPQDIKDEPAKDLLKKIKESCKLINGSRKRIELTPIEKDKIPFEIPTNWIWCKLGDVVNMSRGKFSARPRNDPNYFGGKYPFIQIGSLDEQGSIITSAPQTLNEKGYNVSKEFSKGTIVIAIVGGTIGNLGVLGSPMCFPDSIIGILPSEYYHQEYILYFLKYMQPFIREAAYQMSGQPNIKIPTLAELLLPLPPLEEQQRITKKLTHLVTCCNNLEQNINHSMSQHEKLLQQVREEAVSKKYKLELI